MIDQKRLLACDNRRLTPPARPTYSKRGILMLRYLTRCLLLGAAFWLVLAGSSEGAKVKVWYHANQGHYDKAQFKQAVVTSEGALRLSRLVKPLAGIQA